MVAIDEITHMQGLKDYTMIFTANKKYVIKGTVKHTFKLLPDSEFIRVHKSFIVARKLIKNTYKNRIEIGSFKITVGRTYKKEIDNLLKYISTKRDRD